MDDQKPISAEMVFIQDCEACKASHTSPYITYDPPIEHEGRKLKAYYLCVATMTTVLIPADEGTDNGV